jgi:hypothetical protein
MNDHDFVLERVPGYASYSDEVTRHDTDSRVRAFVGERVQSVRDRFADRLAGAELQAIDDLLMRCRFNDQNFVKELDGADLDVAQDATLVAQDRELLELAERLHVAQFEQVAALVASLNDHFERRGVSQTA